MVARFMFASMTPLLRQIDLHMVARPQFLWASIAGVLVTFGMLGLSFVVPQYLQFVAGHDALDTESGCCP